jgi:hypothetical protein
MNGHFHTADLRSFLRVQKPEQFGEYLGNDRPMIVAANRQRHSMAGLETGTTGIGIRGVVPVGAGDQFAGTFDISLDLSSLLGPLKTDTNADFGIFIDMKVMPDEATKAGDPSTAAHVYGDLRGEDATNWDVIGEVARRSATFVTKEPRFGTAKISGNHYSFVAMPLLDFSGRTIGTIVGALNWQAEHVVLSRLTTRLIAAALLMFIIVGGAFSVILHGFALRPLHTAAAAACRLADGDAIGDLPIPTRRDGVWRLLHALHTISLRLPSSSADSTTASRGVRS